MGIHYTAGKISEEIMRKLSYIILYKLKVPFNSKMISITNIALSPDNKSAKVYVSVIEGKEIGDGVVKKLNNMKGVISRMLLKSMYIKKVPVLTFVYDESIERSVRMNRMLDELMPHSGDE
ncbi:MAG: 30S ribosome-binding factor RbfA [Planctomycetota bacterium]